MRADVVDVVEAGYRLEGDLAAWLAAVGAAARPLLDDGLGLIAHLVDRRRPSSEWIEQPVALGADPAFADALVAVHRRRSGRTRALPYADRAAAVQTASEVFAARDGAPREIGARIAASFGVADVLRIKAWADAGVGVVLAVPLRRITQVDRVRMRRWSRVAAHLAAALRLRRTLAQPEVVFTAAGRLCHVDRDVPASSLEQLRAAVIAIDRARGDQRRVDPDAGLWAWLEVVAGRWSLVDRFDRDGRRYVVALHNPTHAPDPRCCTAQERRVATLVAQCLPNKIIAAELGMAEGTVAAHVASLRRKLGVRSRAVLAELLAGPRDGRWAALELPGAAVRVLSEPRVRPAIDALTPAEREVAWLVIEGASNAEVARRRHTAISTVENQLRRIYAQLGVGSRAELARRLRDS